MHYNPRNLTPGKYGYRCRHCANIAFAFQGDVKPAPGTYLEECEASQRGPHASLRRSKHICQHCGAPVTASNGQVDMECVVDIDAYASALQKRIDSSNSRRGSSRGLSSVVVDRDYMGCGLTAEDQVGEAVKVEPEPEKPKPKPKAAKAKNVDDALGDK